ncbi:hypothetical protein BB561_001756 [Smittium simulii]|uniref:LYR motif-containing protein Cup1-like N-terminal domain-containing protein n=1 Tax=Smittium simulii TaxID=133385 RepID=A0A2T9YT66_9FUNG|nr:hypothetical protein BB561_001756 [Smittium simulii]
MDLFTNTSYAVPHHSKKVVRLIYRQILCQARAFFDDNSREFIKICARQRFRQWKNEENVLKRNNKISTARNYLGKLTRANQGDIRSMQKILELGYGRSGKLKYALLQKTTGLNSISDMNSSILKFKLEMPFLCYLMEKQLGSFKKLKPVLTTSRRILKKNLANLQIKQYEKILGILNPPLPISTIKLIEARANSGIINDLYISNIQHFAANSKIVSTKLIKQILFNAADTVPESHSSNPLEHDTDPIDTKSHPSNSLEHDTDPIDTKSHPSNSMEHDTDPLDTDLDFNNFDSANQKDPLIAELAEHTNQTGSSHNNNNPTNTNNHKNSRLVNSSKQFYLFQSDFSLERSLNFSVPDFIQKYNLALSKGYCDIADFENKSIYACHNLIVPEVSPQVSKWQKKWVKMPENRVIRRLYSNILSKSPYLTDKSNSYFSLVFGLQNYFFGKVPASKSKDNTEIGSKSESDLNLKSNLTTLGSPNIAIDVQPNKNNIAKTDNAQDNLKKLEVTDNTQKSLELGSIKDVRINYSILSKEPLNLKVSKIDLGASFIS